MKYAKIVNSIVENIIVLLKEDLPSMPNDWELIEAKESRIGDYCIDGVFATPSLQPDFDVYSETVQQIYPLKTPEGLYVQQWAIVPLENDALAAAQAQKVEDEKAKIKADIASLEATITPRRTREAILAIDTVWLADVELQIQELRGQL
jgi:hypothetical protein